MISYPRASRASLQTCAALARVVVAWGLLLCAGGCGLLAKAPAGEQPRAENAMETAWQGKRVPYTVSIKVAGGPDSLAGKMRAASQLVQLAKEPPDSLLALERRARADAASAENLLHSQGYYDGTATFEMNSEATPVAVSLLLTPGQRYVLGRADVYYQPEPVVPSFFRNRSKEVGFWGLETEPVPPPSFPTVLPGVAVGKPVTADALLAAMDALPEALRRQGYPLAAVAASSLTPDPQARLLVS